MNSNVPLQVMNGLSGDKMSPTTSITAHMENNTWDLHEKRNVEKFELHDSQKPLTRITTRYTYCCSECGVGGSDK
jgi:hypothetical protein